MGSTIFSVKLCKCIHAISREKNNNTNQNSNIVLPGGSEQVKQVKQLLHRKSEAESAKNLANWQIYPLFLLAASPEITLFLPPWAFFDDFSKFQIVLSIFHFYKAGKNEKKSEKKTCS